MSVAVRSVRHELVDVVPHRWVVMVMDQFVQHQFDFTPPARVVVVFRLVRVRSVLLSVMGVGMARMKHHQHPNAEQHRLRPRTPRLHALKVSLPNGTLRPLRGSF